MRAVTVYRVDFGWKSKDPIGAVLEKRKTERANNSYDLLRLARRLFALDAADAANIIIDVKQARSIISTEQTRECSGGNFEEIASLRMFVAGDGVHLPGSSMVALATNSFEPDTTGILGPGSTPGTSQNS